MSYNKMNVFHWHLTDTQSFPFVSRRVPEMADFGGYSNRYVNVISMQFVVNCTEKLSIHSNSIEVMLLL